MNTAKLNGIRGWLLFYIVVPGILGPVTGLLAALAAEDSLLVFLLMLNLAATSMAVSMRTPIVRTIHIWMYGVAIGLCLLALTVLNDALIPGAIGSIIGLSVWLFYWILSKRVKVTYQVVSPRDAELTLVD